MGLLNLVTNLVSLKENVSKEKVFTLKEKIKKQEYLAIKNRCKAYSLSAKAIRQEAIKNKGEVRRILRTIKIATGQDARIAHVALCFLRGKKYSEVEGNVEDKNRINHNQLKDYLHFFVNYEYAKATSTCESYLSRDIKKFLEE